MIDPVNRSEATLDSSRWSMKQGRAGSTAPSGVGRRGPGEGKILGHALVAGAAVVFFAVTAGVGVDFGHHWDEPLLLDAVRRSVESGVALPGYYSRPSMIYDLALLAALPDGVRLARISPARDAGAQLGALVAQHAFTLRVRLLLIGVTSLALVWTYALAYRLRGDRIEAALATALLATSWEVNYHGRWIAPDAIMMQWGALALMAIVFGMTSVRPTAWIRLAAIAAGLACGTKYPAGLLLGAVLLAFALTTGQAGLECRWRELALLVSLFGLTYIATTPGTLLDPVRFVHGLATDAHQYATWHGGYTVGAGPEHLKLALTYLSMVAFSAYPPVGLLFSGLALVGLVSLCRQQPAIAAVLAGFSVLYIGYMSTQRVMIVRNLLVVTPVLAVLAALGYGDVRHWLRAFGGIRKAVAVVAAAAILLNASWVARAAGSIRRAPSIDHADAATQYMKTHASMHFLLSPRVTRDLRGLPTRTSPGHANGESAIFYAGEVLDWTRWKANRLGRYTVLRPGPFEVNWDYYPSWAGRDRLIAADPSVAREMGVPLE